MHDTRKSIYKNKKKPHGTKKVGANEVGTKKVGANEVGTKEVGTNEVGTKKVSTKKVTFNLDIKKTNNTDKRTRKRGAQHKPIIKNNTRKVAEGGNNTVVEEVDNCNTLENTLNDYKKNNDNCSKSKYNAIALQLHPDKNPDCIDKSTALFQELNQFKKDGCKSKIKGKMYNPINRITIDIEYIISSDKKTITYEGKTFQIKTIDENGVITLPSGVTIVSDDAPYGDTPLAPAQQEAKYGDTPLAPVLPEANALPEAKYGDTPLAPVLPEANALPEAKRVEANAQPEEENPLLLSSVLFQTSDGKSDEEVKKYLIEKMDIDIKKAEDDINQTLASFHEKCQKDPSLNWVDCNGECNTVVTKYIKKEINSTAYILNTLAQSMLSTASSKPTLTIELYVNLENLTGVWSDDNKNMKIISYGDNTQSKDARLVMGFGPSSSGKTFLSETVLNLLSSNGAAFPDTFFSIDGGIYRETSMVYNAIVRIAKEYACVAGFTNLAGGMSMLFKSGSIKKLITSFLEQQKKIGNINISLYVPETLGDCLFCAEKYKPYLDITGDSKWIGLLIWQHKFGKDCIYTDKYKCKGCTESGTERQNKEGKKYSNRAWDRSMKYGMEEMMKAPGGRFKIHNSGQVGHLSIIENYSDIETSNKIRKVFRENEKDVYSYVDKSLVDNKSLVSQAQDIEIDKTKTKKVNIYYIRHGYSCANYERDTKWLPGAQKFVVDPTLHCKGIMQAEKVGEDFKNSGLTIDRICTSQLLRAIQTGLLIRNNLNEKDKKIPFQIVRHMSEKGGKWSPFDYDNIPEHVKLINSKDQSQFLEDNKIVMDNDTTQKSEYEKYINIILPQMVVNSIQKENKDEYNFIFVSHSSLLNKMYGTKLDNGQSIIRHYIFTNNGLMIQETPETPDDDAFKKDKLSSAYSKEYPFNKKIENCNICSNKISLDNITELLNPDKLHELTTQGAANSEKVGKQKINGFILNEAGESEPAEFMIDISKSHSVSIGSEKYKIKNIYKKDTDIIVETDSKKFKIPYNEENSHYERLYIDNWYFLLREEISTRRRAIEYIKDGKTYTQFIYDNGNNRGDVTKINKDIPSIENVNLKIISTRVGVNSHFYQLWDDEYKNAIKNNNNNNIPEFNETEQKAIDALKDEVNKEVVYEAILTKEQIDDIRQGKPLPIEKEIEEYFIRGHPVSPDRTEISVNGEASASVDSDDDSSIPDKNQSEPSGSVQGEASAQVDGASKSDESEASAPVDSSNSSGAGSANASNGASPSDEDDEDWEKIETSESIINNIIYTPYGFELLIDLTKF